MNQILMTKLKSKSNIKIFKFQFVFSIIISIVLISFFIYYIQSLNNQEKLADNLIGNYNIYKLYANNTPSYSEENSNNLFGIIEIPKINVYYPIFSTINEDLLKISPCLLAGKSLTENGNICIAGHNYNNSMFFSNLNLLSVNDEILIYDNLGQNYKYTVFDSYEVHEDDLSPIFNYNPSSKELTLITCNNLNSNRLIIKAKR